MSNNKISITCLIIYILSVLTVNVNNLEIKIMTNESPFNQKELHDFNNLKLSINANNNYVYPHHKNSFSMYFSSNIVLIYHQAEIL